MTLGNFRRKFWMWVLAQAQRRLCPEEVTACLEPYWWGVVRLRLAELAHSDLGLNTVELLFLGNEGDADRDLRDRDRDVRGDRS